MSDLEIRPATPDRWDDVVALAGPNGFYAGCWCAWWLTTAKEFDSLGHDGRRAVLERLVRDGDVPPGLLAYRGSEPVAWVAVGPRDRFGRLQRSPKLGPVDDEPAWIVACFVVRRDQRGTGVSRALLDAATAFAADHGATVVEGVPIDTGGSRSQSASLYTGTLSTFESAGFVEIARRGGRPVVRRPVGPPVRPRPARGATGATPGARVGRRPGG